MLSSTETSKRRQSEAGQKLTGIEPSVHGLNLAVPEDAKEIIKPWEERDDNTKYAESGVDDQV